MYQALVLYLAAGMDCCLDIVVLTVPRVPESEWASAAARVTAALTAEVHASQY